MPAKKTETADVVEVVDIVEADSEAEAVEAIEAVEVAETKAEKKPAAKKTPAKKAAAKKPAAKKADEKDAEAKEEPAKKPAPKKESVKTATKKAPAKKVAEKKEPATKKAPTKRTATKKTAVKATLKPASTKKRIEKKNLVDIPKSEVSYSATGRRKDAVARVRLIPGTGRVYCNHREGAEYFGRQQHIDFALVPLKAVGQDGTFDIIATLHGGGVGGQAGALRLGIARALLEVNPDYRGELKRAGLLKRDPRVVERKKYGLKKARKRPQFSKR